MNIAGRVSDAKTHEEAGRPLQSDCISAAPASAPGRLIDVPGLRRGPAENRKDLHLAQSDVEVFVDNFVALSTERAPAGVG